MMETDDFFLIKILSEPDQSQEISIAEMDNLGHSKAIRLYEYSVQKAVQYCHIDGYDIPL